MRTLVTSVGRRVQLVRAFMERVRVLSVDGCVIGADASRTAPAAFWVDEFELVPLLSDPGYADHLLDLARAHAVDVVIPTIDTELQLLADRADDFRRQGTEVLVSSPETVRLAADKLALAAWLDTEAFPGPRTAPLPAATALFRPPDFPLVVKPVRGSSSQGVHTITAWDDLPADVAESPHDYIAQRLVVGEEYTVSTYVDRAGMCRCAVPRLRLAVRGGEVSKAETRRIGAVAELARTVVERLPGAWGPLNVQIIHDEAASTSAVIEVNARFGGGDPLAWRAGADIPSAALAEVLHSEVPDLEGWRDRLQMLRYDEAVYVHGGLEVCRD